MACPGGHLVPSKPAREVTADFYAAFLQNSEPSNVMLTLAKFLFRPPPHRKVTDETVENGKTPSWSLCKKRRASPHGSTWTQSRNYRKQSMSRSKNTACPFKIRLRASFNPNQSARSTSGNSRW